MNANELADELRLVRAIVGSGQVLNDAEAMLRTIPKLEAEIEALKLQRANRDAAFKVLQKSEGWDEK